MSSPNNNIAKGARFSQVASRDSPHQDDTNDVIEKVNRSFGRHLSLSLTKRCPLKCAHCIVSCMSATDTSLDMPDRVVDNVINAIPLLSKSVSQISFTGGEPFLRADLMNLISGVAQGEGIVCGAVTSASWASNPRKAEAELAALPCLSHITVSSDVYHEEYLPRRNVRNAISAANYAGVSCSIRVCVPPKLDEAHKKFLEEMILEFGDLVHTQEVVDFGRASELSLAQVLTDRPPTLPCLSSGPHISQSGNVVPCCSALRDDIPEDHPLNLGDATVQSVTSIFEMARSNPLLLLIRLWGFRDIVDQLKREFPEKYENLKFVDEGQCSLCATIMHDKESVAYLTKWVAEIEMQAKIAVGAWAHFDNRKPMLNLSKKKAVMEGYLRDV